MPKNNDIKRVSAIKADFDRQAIWRLAEEANQKREPNQKELASDYGSDADTIECVRTFPAFLDEIVAGICAQDDRFLDQGRKLLKQLLCKNAAATDEPKRARSRRKRTAGNTASEAREATPSGFRPGIEAASDSAPVDAAGSQTATSAHTISFDAAALPSPDLYGD